MIIVTVARRPLSESTVASNVLAHGTGALNIDACRIGTSESDREEMLKMSRGFVGRKFGRPEMMNYGYEESMATKTLSVPAPSGRWPANLIIGHLDGCKQEGCAAGCPVAHLDAQSGETQSPKTYVRGADGYNNNTYSQAMGEPSGTVSLNYGDTGTASRFFKQVGGRK